MPENHACGSVSYEKEIKGVVYAITSHFSASGSLDEILKKAVMEAVRDSENSS